jgi:hypothetical protein
MTCEWGIFADDPTNIIPANYWLKVSLISEDTIHCDTLKGETDTQVMAKPHMTCGKVIAKLRVVGGTRKS